MLISADEAQLRRTPSELRRFAVGVRAAVRADKVEFDAGMRRQGIYKEFLDEIEPLSEYAVAALPESCFVQPVLGNQGYDAIVFGEDGQAIERIELAKPFDGATAARLAREGLRNGLAGFKAVEPGTELDPVMPIIERTAKSKSLKDYSDSTIVFLLPNLPHYPGFELQYDEQLRRVRDKLAECTYRAKRVLMFVPPDRVQRMSDLADG